jgi:hypothetical protein
MGMKKRIHNWRTIPDSILLAKSYRMALDKPESLHPTEETMLRYCFEGDGHDETVGIIHSYYRLLAPVIDMVGQNA